MPRLLLLGSGLPHLVVLDALRRHRAAAEVTLVAREALLAHQAMVPGYLAGRYAPDEIRVDLAEAATAAGATFMAGEVTALDPAARRITTGDGRDLAYDVVSIALEPGALPAHRPAPSVHTVGSLAEAQTLADALDRLAAAAGPEPRKVVILGASEFGVELALAIRTRLDRQGAGDVMITMLESRSELFGGRLQAWSDRVERVLAERDITLRLGIGASEIGADFVRLSDGRVQPADVVVAAPPPAPWPVLASAGLPADTHGLLLVDETLQVQGHSVIFGAGPNISLISTPRALLPTTAQYRMGRVLAKNLAQVLQAHDPTHRFRVKERELTLLDAGDGRAVVLGGPVATVSRWALRYKQLGDRRLVTRLRTGPAGTPPPDRP